MIFPHWLQPPGLYGSAANVKLSKNKHMYICFLVKKSLTSAVSTPRRLVGSGYSCTHLSVITAWALLRCSYSCVCNSDWCLWLIIKLNSPHMSQVSHFPFFSPSCFSASSFSLCFWICRRERKNEKFFLFLLVVTYTEENWTIFSLPFSHL